MTGWSDVARQDWPEARESQQPHGQRSHAATPRDTHTGIFMKGRAMSERERWAYEELRAGDPIQEGDQWLNPDGRWQAVAVSAGPAAEVWCSRVRRPYRVSTILEIGDALASAQKAATQLQDERDEARKDRDLARAEVARLSTELWARKPLEDRVAALTDEVTQLRVERQEWIDWYDAKGVNALQVSEQLTAAKDALKTAQRARDELQLQVDELRAGLMGIVSAEHVHSMLEDMLDQTEWVGQCLDSSTYEQISCIQRTISVIAERVRDMGKEVTSADA